MSDVNKKSWLFIGFECLYVLLGLIITAVACYVQFLGLKETGRYSGVIFGGAIYSYNIFAYVSGLILFLDGLVVGYILLLRKFMMQFNEIKLFAKIAYFVIAVMFSAAVLFEGLMINLLKFGLAGSVDKEVLENITIFGWPVFVIVFMIVIFLKNQIDAKRNIMV